MKNIFVGNLDFTVSEDAIQELFQRYGAVERVSVGAIFGLSRRIGERVARTGISHAA